LCKLVRGKLGEGVVVGDTQQEKKGLKGRITRITIALVLMGMASKTAMVWDEVSS